MLILAPWSASAESSTIDVLLQELRQSPPPKQKVPAIVRLEFIDVETVGRLSYWEQKAHLHRLYFVILPELRKNYVVGLALPIPGFDQSGTPTEIADRILAHPQGGAAWLNSLALDRCREILRSHRREVIPWVARELKSEGGFSRIDHLLLFEEHFAELVELLNRPDAFTAWSAAIALCSNEVDDPRAISLIVRRFPNLKPAGAHADCNLWYLQKNRKANPDLMRLLASSDPAVRFQAVKALEESGDPDLLPVAERLLSDPEERVRKSAAIMLKVIRAR